MKTIPPRTATSLWKRIILSAVLIIVELWAFSLSFEHHVKTAIGAGYSPDLAPRYPLVIDGAIVAATLVLIWWPQLTKGQRGYMWFAIAIWTTLSGINNAISILTGDTSTLAFPVEVAIAVNTVPTVTQFLVLHIVYLALHHDQGAPRRAQPNLFERLRGRLLKLDASVEEKPRSQGPTQAKPRTAPTGASTRSSVSQAEIDAMVTRHDGGDSYQVIAADVQLAKSTVGKLIKDERDARERGLRAVV